MSKYKNTSKEEKDSRGNWHDLPTAEDLKLTKRPCDICKKKSGSVRFWGATSVLICSKEECQDKMAENWAEAMKSTEDTNY